MCGWLCGGGDFHTCLCEVALLSPFRYSRCAFLHAETRLCRIRSPDSSITYCWLGAGRTHHPAPSAPNLGHIICPCVCRMSGDISSDPDIRGAQTHSHMHCTTECNGTTIASTHSCNPAAICSHQHMHYAFGVAGADDGCRVFE